MKKLFLMIIALMTVSILYGQQETWNGNSTGKLTNTTAKVGVGTTSPDMKLDVRTDQSSIARFHHTGTLGIGGVRIGKSGSYSDLVITSSGFGIGTGTNGSSLPIGTQNSSLIDLFIQNSSGNVGIGTNSPLEKLHVNGKIRIEGNNSLIFNATSATDPYNALVFRQQGNTKWLMDYATGSTQDLRFIKIDGSSTKTFLNLDYTNNQLEIPDVNVGIGTTDPLSKLDVRIPEKSGLLATFLSDAAINSGTEVNKWTLRLGRSFDYPNRTLDFGMVSDSYGQNPAFFIAPKGVEAFRVDKTGNVGIGTTNPDAKLAVNGQVHSQEVLVDMNGWSDFVFADDYQLEPLEKVEEFINANKHLPEIPSEAEVLENGIKLGEMDAKLLQKIEELTLHMIEMNKSIKKLQTENQGLKEELFNKQKK